MNKICIVGVYIGKLPNYFRLWLKSCAYNPKIDFILFTDNNINDLPDNVIHHKTTLLDIKKRASKILGFDISLERPYKLCDYKPLYGLIFREYLEKYRYWGHCDFDLIFGDLFNNFSKFGLDKYDRFGSLGHLSLYKNNNIVNNSYKLIGSVNDYKTVYKNDRSFAFDETYGTTKIFLENKFKFFTKRIFADISAKYTRFRLGVKYDLDAIPINYEYQIFYWENGRCYRGYFNDGKFVSEEYLYIHFQKRPNFTLSFDVNEVDAFYITEYGFIPKIGDVTIDVVKRHNPYKGKWYEFFEEVMFNCKYYFKRASELIGTIFK